MSLFELKLLPFPVISFFPDWGKRHVASAQTNLQMGYRISQYFEISQTGKMNKKDPATNPRMIISRKKLFGFIVLGLLKSAINDSGVVDKERILSSERQYNDVAALSEYLELEDWRTNEILDFAVTNHDSFDKISPLTLTHTEKKLHSPNNRIDVVFRRLGWGK